MILIIKNTYTKSIFLVEELPVEVYLTNNSPKVNIIRNRLIEIPSSPSSATMTSLKHQPHLPGIPSQLCIILLQPPTNSKYTSVMGPGSLKQWPCVCWPIWSICWHQCLVVWSVFKWSLKGLLEGTPSRRGTSHPAYWIATSPLLYTRMVIKHTRNV